MRRILGWAALALLGGVACDNSNSPGDGLPRVVDIDQLGSSVVYIDSGRSAAYFVDVEAESLRSASRRVPLRANPGPAIRRPGKDELLLVSEGQKSPDGDWSEVPALAEIAADGSVKTFDLKPRASMRRASIMTPTSDGRYVLVTGSAVGDDQSMLSNRNEVEVVDLEAKADADATHSRALRSFVGDLRETYAFSAVKTPAGTLPLALFGFPGGVSVWDLSHPERPEIRVEIPELGASAGLARVVADEKNGKIYLALPGVTDVLVLTTSKKQANSLNGFSLVLNQLSVGFVPPTDLLVYTDLGGQRLLAVGGSSLSVIESGSNRVTSIPLPYPARSFLPFTGVSPDSPGVGPRVLAYAASGEQGRTALGVNFIDLEGLEAHRDRQVSGVALASPVVKLEDISYKEAHRALLVLGGSQVGSLDLDKRQFVPISVNLSCPSGGSCVSVYPDRWHERVWLVADGNYRVGAFSLSDFTTTEIALDDPTSAYGPLFFGAGDQRRVVIPHNSSGGSLTVFSAVDQRRSKAQVLDGFLFESWGLK